MKDEKRIVRHKDGLTVYEKRKKVYEKNEALTESGILFIEEVEPELRRKNSSSNYLMAIRKAKMKCFCGKEFTNKITLIKNGRVRSCGCERVRIVTERHKNKGNL